ncbi:tetratricopeptide repeat protein [Skermanella rosea]|uniref:tetratricopeptide repeat protein n=1 Tax=Skermanella rosea TaxID=1817965 RepID=UPI001933BEB2|nr:tetratricopeptide repeat protein [Skermanella rosea]UEM03932.1 tetratricopeptide repeat protein [Skermanella rosea]
MRDRRGEPLSTDDPASGERLDAAVALMNGYFTDPLAVIDRALEERPDFVMGHCFRAGLLLIAAQKSVEPELRRSVEAAEALAGTANDRERGHIAAARAWLDGDFHRTPELYGRVLEDHPGDLAALQFAHQCDFFVGDAAALRDRPAGVLARCDPDLPGHGFVLGMHAFGLEENRDFAAAEEQGRRAVELIPRNPWAIHAVAHVMEMQGRSGEGIAWMRDREADWAPDNLLAVHNWWHLALHHLDRCETGAVLEIYDRHVRPRPEAIGLELSDATALLWRLHLAGIDAGDRWREVADGWEPMAGDGYYAFNDMHAMMAFVAAGREQSAARLAAALADRGAGTGTNAAMTRDVGLPACLGLLAFGRGDYAAATDLLLPLPAISRRFGGSDAQRDVIALTLLEAAQRAGRTETARDLAARRIELKPRSAFTRLVTEKRLNLG